MDISSEKNTRRVLAAGVLFATVGIVALIITLMQPNVQEEREKLAKEIFSTPTPEEKMVILESLAASSTGSEVSVEEKLRVLESLRTK